MLSFGCVADTYPAGEALLRRGAKRVAVDPAWLADARACLMTGRPRGLSWPPQRPANCTRPRCFARCSPIWQTTRTAC